MDTQEATKSKMIKVAALAIGVFLVILASFAGGVAVGLKKARFSYKFGENYERNFVGSHRIRPDFPPGPQARPGLPFDPESRDFRNAHGLAGAVISISDNNIIVRDRDGKENTVAVTDKTIIKRQSDDIKIGDLKKDDRIVVMGSPGDNGVVNADLVRVFSGSENN
ncbi:MAG: hypothetical protein WC831_01125 [Parcubacteria group bacterium]|jgi:hypothetical protein